MKDDDQADGGPLRREPLAKAVKVLTWMVDRGGDECGVREIATALGIAVSTVYRVLRDLEGEGLVGRTDDGRYSLGLEFLRLAARATNRGGLPAVALPIMRELADACGESVLLGLYDPGRGKMIFAASVESDHPLRYVVTLNEWIPIEYGASGIGILAFLPQEEQDRILDQGRLEPVTPATIVDRDELAEVLVQTREQGYACTHSSRIPGAVGISAPIFNGSAEVIGDVVVTIPEHRFDGRAQPRLAALIKDSASKVTHAVGGRRPELVSL